MRLFEAAGVGPVLITEGKLKLDERFEPNHTYYHRMHELVDRMNRHLECGNQPARGVRHDCHHVEVMKLT